MAQKQTEKRPTEQPTQAGCGYIKNGIIYSSYDGRKIGRIK